MGLLDIDYDELIKKALASQEPDKKSALSSGLLAAGLGILANSNRRGAEPFGVGGMMGLQAYGDNLQQQKKDPLAQIQMAQAIQGLQTSQQNQQAMKQWQGGFAPQTAPMRDFAPGEAPGPATPQPQIMPAAQQMPSAESLMQFMRSPNPTVASQAKDYFDRLYKPFEVGAGAKRFDPATGRVIDNPDPSKPMLQPNGTYGFAPGVMESLTAQKRGEVEASERAKADLDVITVTEGGRPRQVSRSQWLKEQQGQPQGDVGQMATQAYAAYLKGDQSKPFTFTYNQPKSKANPTKAEEAAQQAAATAPITLDTEYSSGLIKQNLGFRETILKEDKAARAQSSNIDRFLQLNKDPNVAQGKYAEAFSGLKNAAASFGVEVKGASSEQVMQGISNQMALQLRNPDSGMGMPGAMSDADREFLKSMPPGLNQTKEGRELTADLFQTVNARKVEVARMLLKHEAAGGKVDGEFLRKMADHADKNPMFGEAHAKRLETSLQEKPESKVTGKTRDYHIQNVFKTGTEEQKRKLRAAGYTE